MRQQNPLASVTEIEKYISKIDGSLFDQNATEILEQALDKISRLIGIQWDIEDDLLDIDEESDLCGQFNGMYLDVCHHHRNGWQGSINNREVTPYRARRIDIVGLVIIELINNRLLTATQSKIN